MTAPIRLNAAGGSARASTLGSSAAGLGNAVTETPGGVGSFGPLPLPERWVLPAAARLGEARTAVVARGACACDGTGGPRGSNLCGLAALRDRLAGGVLPPALRALAALDMSSWASHRRSKAPTPLLPCVTARLGVDQPAARLQLDLPAPLNRCPTYAGCAPVLARRMRRRATRCVAHKGPKVTKALSVKGEKSIPATRHFSEIHPHPARPEMGIQTHYLP